jgi:threonine synthase
MLRADTRYASTRASIRGQAPVSLDRALVEGIAPDGGLYLPLALPAFVPGDFAAAASLGDVARILLAPFFAGSALEPALADIVDETFGFPVPETPLPGGRRSLLELFHGPTAAFKDVGAGFLAACLARLEGDAADPLTVLVATSGDTGGAVAAAFDGRPGMRVVVLFPDGRVSERQARQLTCWGDNVLSLCVAGTFDDCQAIVKAALGDAGLARRYRFSSANSINIGRLLPQATYYADAALRHFRACGERPGFIIPTGNLGNALACLLAKEMGLPIGPVVLATNANRTIPDYLATRRWEPRASIATLASAMDVGNPSNMERLRVLLGDAGELAEKLDVVAVDDPSIRDEIRAAWEEFGFAICPHTATASRAWRRLPPTVRDGAHWIIVATAHPAKFETIVEPLIGTAVPVPPELAGILSRPSRSVRIDATPDAFAAALDDAFGGRGSRAAP